MTAYRFSEFDGEEDAADDREARLLAERTRREEAVDAIRRNVAAQRVAREEALAVARRAFTDGVELDASEEEK